MRHEQVKAPTARPSWAGVVPAWAVAGTTTALLTGGVVGQVLVGETRPVGELVVAGLVLAVATVLTVRRPGNRVGWVYATSAHAFAWLSVPGVLMATDTTVLAAPAAWVASWAWMLAFGLPATFGLLWFPDGRLPSSGWRWLQGLLVGTYVAAVATAAVLPFEVVGADVPVANPLALPSLVAVIEPVFLAAAAGIVACALGCAASVAVRWRRARGVERQQVKWVAVAGGTSVGLFALGDVVTRLPLVTWDLVYALAIGLPAVAVALAVLRYRLYDLDRIVSRTVSYGLLTGLLAAVYVTAVFLLQRLLRPVTGESDVAVAGATLLVAALFGPARRRLQAVVDRRFNRARYDAERTWEDFRTRLRDDVDLDHIDTELVAAVRATMEPARLSLWLRAPERAS